MTVRFNVRNAQWAVFTTMMSGSVWWWYKMTVECGIIIIIKYVILVQGTDRMGGKSLE